MAPFNRKSVNLERNFYKSLVTFFCEKLRDITVKFYIWCHYQDSLTFLKICVIFLFS